MLYIEVQQTLVFCMTHCTCVISKRSQWLGNSIQDPKRVSLPASGERSPLLYVQSDSAWPWKGFGPLCRSMGIVLRSHYDATASVNVFLLPLLLFFFFPALLLSQVDVFHGFLSPLTLLEKKRGRRRVKKKEQDRTKEGRNDSLLGAFLMIQR